MSKNKRQIVALVMVGFMVFMTFASVFTVFAGL